MKNLPIDFNNKKKLLVFNSITGVMQLMLTCILVFLSVPVFTGRLGIETFGVFGAVSVIGNLAVYANLSLDATLLKYLSEQGKSQESDFDISVALVTLAGVILPLTFILFLFRDFFLSTILRIPAGYIPSSTVLLEYLLLANVFLLLGRVFSTILDANHKIYLTNFYMLVYNILYWGGIIFVILTGHGLERIGLVVFLAALTWFILVACTARKIWGKIRFKGLRSNFKRIVKKQLRYGTKIAAGSILNFFYEPLTKVLISHLMGLSYVAVYEVVIKIKGNLMSLYQRLSYPIQPLIAEENDPGRLRLLIERISGILFYLIIPVIVILIVCTKPIMILWVPELDTHLVTLSSVIIISLSLLLVTTVTPVYYFLRLKNHPEKEIYLQGMNVLVNLLVIFVFYRQMGFYSIILGSAMSLLLPFMTCVYYQKKYLDFSPLSGWKESVKYVSVFVSIGLATTLFSFLFKEIAWINVLFVSSFCCLLSLGVFYYTKILKIEDLSLLK